MRNTEPMSRRDFLTCATSGMAAGVMTATALAAQTPPGLTAEERRTRRILLKGGTILTLDPAVGDFERGDVLIEDSRIAAVAPDIQADGASVVDASGTIVLPGFVDTHHHQYQTVLRGILADGILSGPRSYSSDIHGILTPAYRPEDAYVCELAASLSQINAGVTTGIDISQVSHSPEHSDACIQGLRESRRRMVFAYSPGTGPESRFPDDIRRLRKEHFSSADQLLTLAMGGGANAQLWALAREVSAPIVNHIVGNSAALIELGKAGLMGPDNEYIHCTRLDREAWRMIADTGGKVSIACPIEMQMRHGMPPIQEALDHGIRPSLSADVETNMTADMFMQMRSVFTLQRALLNERALAGEENLPPLLTCREVLEFATIEGAKCAHLDHLVGTLTPGKQADIVMLDATLINVMPLNNAPAAVVTLMDTSNVRNVFVAGRLVKADGRLLDVDLNRLSRQLGDARDALLSRAGYARNLFASCCAPGI